jgi:hypothetical protein
LGDHLRDDPARTAPNRVEEEPLSWPFTVSAGELTEQTPFASRGPGVQIPSAPLGIAGQGPIRAARRAFEDHLSPRCHWDGASQADIWDAWISSPGTLDALPSKSVSPQLCPLSLAIMLASDRRLPLRLKRVRHGSCSQQCSQEPGPDGHLCIALHTASSSPGAQDSTWPPVTCRGLPGSYLAVGSRHACTAAASVS